MKYPIKHKYLYFFEGMPGFDGLPGKPGYPGLKGSDGEWVSYCYMYNHIYEILICKATFEECKYLTCFIIE